MFDYDTTFLTFSQLVCVYYIFYTLRTSITSSIQYMIFPSQRIMMNTDCFFDGKSVLPSYIIFYQLVFLHLVDCV